MEVGKIIKAQRTSHDLTQEELANEFFVSRQLVSKWENGKSYPDLEQLLKLSDYFDLSLDELMRGDTKMIKQLTFTLKKKQMLLILTGVLAFLVISFSYFWWTNRSIQLKPADIEVMSIKVEAVEAWDKLNVATGETITLPADVSYTINYKIKKAFTVEQTGYHVQVEADSANLYVDLRGRRSLFPSKKAYTFQINPDAKIYQNDNMVLDDNYVSQVIKNKDVKILDIKASSESKFTKVKGWLWLNKSELN